MNVDYDKRFYTFKGGENAVLDKAEVVILPVPYDGTASYKPGARFGPLAVIRSSWDQEPYDKELDFDASDSVRMHTLPELFPTFESPKAMIGRVENVFHQLVRLNKFTLMLGGEHSITYGAVKPWFEKLEGDLSVLHFDAHFDLKDSYDYTKFSHASVMRRIRDLECDTVHVGVRSSSEDEEKYVKANGLENKVVRGSFSSDSASDIVRKLDSDNVYFTVDVDGFDPSIMPGTATLEPNGVQWEPFMSLMKELFTKKNVVGMDLTEVLPQPNTTLTEDNAARIAYKALGLKFHNK